MAELFYAYVNHDLQKGKLWRSLGKIDVPEVFWLKNLSIPLKKEIQFLVYNLNQPYMSKNQFRRFFGVKTVVANSGGFDKEGDPRADFINKRNLGSPLPVIGKSYVFGGSIIRGTVEDGWLTVETIDINKPLPKLAELKLKPWLITNAIGVDEHGKTYPLPYCGGHEVKYPLLSRGPVRVQLYKNVDDKPIPYLTKAT